MSPKDDLLRDTDLPNVKLNEKLTARGTIGDNLLTEPSDIGYNVKVTTDETVGQVYLSRQRWAEFNLSTSQLCKILLFHSTLAVRQKIRLQIILILDSILEFIQLKK
jgi:hypothetical protein